MTAARHILLLTAKDLRIEARSRQTLGLVVVLGVLIVVVLGLGLGSQQGAGGSSNAALSTVMLWVAYLFAGVLCFEKTMGIERDDGALAGLMLAPVDRGVIYASKLLSNLTLMVALAVVVTPVGVLLFNFDLTGGPAGGPAYFALIMALSFVGLASLGTMLAAATSSSRLQGGLLSMVVLPVCLPLVITSTQLCLTLFRDGRTPPLSGLMVLVAFDAIYLVVSWLVFEWVLEA